MKKTTKVVLTIVSILVVAIGALTYWQFGNIKAAINGVKYSSEDLATQLEVERSDLKAKVDQYTASSITDLSAEDEQKLLSGAVTIEEISEKYNLPIEVMNGSVEQTTVKTTEGTKSTNVAKVNQPTTDNSKEIDDAISAGVSKMYALKAKYVSRIGELQRIAYDEYTSLPPESRNANAKKNILTKNISNVAAMESNCDKEVANVLSVLDAQLKALNGDTQIITILRDAYENEKAVKKAYYISLYKNLI